MPQATTRDGLKLSYEITGQGEPLLMLGGYGMPGAFWSVFVETMAQQFQVVTYDNIGTGTSDIAPHHRTIEEFASDSSALLDELGWENCHLLAGSMGTMVSQQLALEEPERVRSMILLGAYCGKPSFQEILKNDPQRGNHLKKLQETLLLMPKNPQQSAKQLGELCYDPNSFSNYAEFIGLVTQIFTQLPTQQPPLLFSDNEPTISTWQSYDRLSKIKAPTLIFHGAQDGILPVRGAFEMALAMPHAELLIVNPAKHAVITEMNFERTLGYAAQWLKQVVGN